MGEGENFDDGNDKNGDSSASLGVSLQTEYVLEETAPDTSGKRTWRYYKNVLHGKEMEHNMSCFNGMMTGELTEEEC